jgi:general secretion pathway protein K
MKLFTRQVKSVGRGAMRPNSGIALIIVMIMVVVFAALASGLYYSMKVETKLARNSSWDTELEWLGRSGIELAKAFLTPCGPGGGQYDALNQRWAGGTGETNDCLEGLSLTDNQLGHGKFSVEIKDADSKFNINLAPIAPEVVNQALILMGVDGAEAPHIVSAIGDWIDRDDNPRVGGTDTESDYYMSLRPPYRAKNGPIDDLTEMLAIKGVTPAMYYGSRGGGVAQNRGIPISNRFNQRPGAEESYPIGFQDLFTTISGRFININTASAEVLQLIPDVDGNLAQAIIETRNGPDHAQGNEDDMPFRSIGELANVPGMTPQIGQMFSRYFSTRSSTFEVKVTCEVDAVTRTYFALLRRGGPGGSLVTCYMYWR